MYLNANTVVKADGQGPKLHIVRSSSQFLTSLRKANNIRHRGRSLSLLALVQRVKQFPPEDIASFQPIDGYCITVGIA